MYRKLIAILIGLVLILTIFPGTVFFAADGDVVLDKSKGNPVTGFGFDGALADPLQSDRPYYVGDPAVMVDGDTTWLYCGRDAATGNGYNIPYWVAYSSKDLETWTYHGEVTSANRSNITWTNNDTSAWASQVIKHFDPALESDYYYHYYCTGSPQNIGVAVADTPTGWSSLEAKEAYCQAKGIYIRQPASLLFTDIGHPLIHNTVSWPYHAAHDDIDPTVWTEKDENGKTRAYIGWGNTWLWIAELNEDMISLKDQNGDGLITMKTNRSLQTRTGAVMVDHAITAANNSNNNATTQIVDVPYTYPGIRTAGTTAITYPAFNPDFDTTISPYEAAPAVPRTITKTIPVGASYPDGDIVVSRFYTPNKYGTRLTTPWRNDDRTVQGIENEGRNLTDMLWYNEDGSLQGIYLWRWNEKEQVMDPFYQFYTEGPWIYRRQDADGNYFGKYYAFFATDYQEQLVYATTDNLMDAAWEVQGSVMGYSNTAITRHASVFDRDGQAYIAQHDGSLAFGSGHRRAVNFEELNFDENGLIVSSFKETSTGLTGTTSWIQDIDGNFITHESFRTDRDGFYVASTPTTRRTYPIISTRASAIGLNMESSDNEDDSRWEIVQGTSDPSDPTLVSIESWNHPGLYLKADGSNIILSARSSGNSYPTGASGATTIDTMKKETTFRTVPALNGKEGMVSFESVATSGMYMTVVDTGTIKDLRLSNGTDVDACSFTVTSRAALKSISASKVKTIYTKDGELNLDDLTVTALRQDGTTEGIKDYSVDTSGIDMGVLGKQTITVSYQEDNFFRTADLEIEVIKTPVPDVLWYKFDEDSGNTAADNSGNARNGTRNGTGAAFSSPGVNNGYLSLNAGNQNNGYVSVPNATISGVTDFTISAWVKLDAYDTNMKVFDFGGSNRRMSFTVSSGVTGGNMTYLVKTNTTNNLRVINTPTYFQVGKWTHLAVTQSGQRVIIYVDGVPVASRDDVIYNPSSLTSPNANYIGRSSISYDRYFRGGIDDFRMYGSALSEDQIGTIAQEFAAPISSIAPVNVETTFGTAPELPNTVSVTYEDGQTFDTAVKWDAPSADQLAGSGSYEIDGYVLSDVANVTANVKVMSESLDDSLAIVTSVHDKSVDFVIERTAPGTTEVRLICAAYNGTQLVSSVSKLASVTAGQRLTETLSVPDGIEASIVKGFVWSAGTLVPLSAKDLELNRVLEQVNINGDLSDVRDNITLPKTTEDGVAISWSTDPAVITTEDIEVPGYDPMPAGVITRGDSDTPVRLTATVTKYGVTASKTFDIVIKAAPVSNGTDDELGAYLYMGFKNLSGDQQQIYFATSRDGFIWTNFLNDGNAILRSTMGAHGLRDPHIVRSPHGDKFYIVATDLDSNPGEWYRYANFGSTSIMIWESTDLVNWSEQRMVDIAPPGAGCVWAPESMYDEKTGEYVVYFSAHMNGVNVGGAVGQKKVWICKTRDFITFSEPEVFVDTLPGTTTTGVIDTTMIKAGDRYYRYTKNEDGNRIFSEWAPQILHTTWTRVNPDGYIRPVSTRAYEGPAIYKVNNEDKWCLMLDEYSGTGSRRYTPFVSTDLSNESNFQNPADGTVRMPQDARACHGVVLPITNGEYGSIMTKWGNE